MCALLALTYISDQEISVLRAESRHRHPLRTNAQFLNCELCSVERRTPFFVYNSFVVRRGNAIGTGRGIWKRVVELFNCNQQPSLRCSHSMWQSRDCTLIFIFCARLASFTAAADSQTHMRSRDRHRCKCRKYNN